MRTGTACFQSVNQHTWQHYSTETAVTVVHNDNVGLVSDLMMVDLSTALDTVDHSIPMDILSERFGVEKLGLDEKL